ncbi:MAG: hypothetical protein KKA51_07005, partial [Nanoarchaeota archaeon]|nr:hypothetical protein [Nanoarchaeota archaeon]MBU2442656.1 hypothetical protein [Nanoarchaeota archaeon]
MQKNSKVSVEGTGLGINLHSITGLTICSTGTIDNPEASGCQVFWEAKVTATNQNLMLKNPTIDSNRLMPSSIGTDFTIKTGDSKNVFGYVLRFEKSDGQTAVFIVDKVLNPVIEFDSTSSGYVISGEGYISSPTMKSEGQETNMGVKSITYTPGDMSIRVKTKNSNDVQEIYADLQEGILVPTTKEGQSRNILIKSDYSNLELSLQDEDVVATTRAEIVSKESGLYVKSSDGRELEVKILPSVAAERAREVLGEKYDRIELKDGGRLSYEVSKDYQGRIVGIIPIKVRHSALIDADSGNLIETQKPWYNFLVTGQK